jgi:hypothetical protein
VAHAGIVVPAPRLEMALDERDLALRQSRDSC